MRCPCGTEHGRCIPTFWRRRSLLSPAAVPQYIHGRGGWRFWRFQPGFYCSILKHFSHLTCRRLPFRHTHHMRPILRRRGNPFENPLRHPCLIGPRGLEPVSGGWGVSRGWTTRGDWTGGRLPAAARTMSGLGCGTADCSPRPRLCRAASAPFKGAGIASGVHEESVAALAGDEGRGRGYHGMDLLGFTVMNRHT